MFTFWQVKTCMWQWPKNFLGVVHRNQKPENDFEELYNAVIANKLVGNELMSHVQLANVS